MSRYWLTPILCKLPLKLGADRICCEPSADLDAFRSKLHTIHPWLLPMFKTSLLLSDDEEICGSTSTRIEWIQAKDLVFDGEPLLISHCAEAFFDRLLSAEKAASFIHLDSKTNSSQDWTSIQLDWLKRISQWLHEGHEVILLREDGV